MIYNIDNISGELLGKVEDLKIETPKTFSSLAMIIVETAFSLGIGYSTTKKATRVLVKAMLPDDKKEAFEKLTDKEKDKAVEKCSVTVFDFLCLIYGKNNKDEILKAQESDEAMCGLFANQRETCEKFWRSGGVLRTKVEPTREGKGRTIWKRCETVSEALLKMNRMKIQTIADFNGKDSLDMWGFLKSVTGINDAGASYVFMLTGREDICKFDTHIKAFVSKGCPSDGKECGIKKMDYFTAQLIFRGMVKKYNIGKRDKVTVRTLEYSIWKREIENKSSKMH